MKFFTYMLSLFLVAGFAVACNSSGGGDEDMNDGADGSDETMEGNDEMPATVVDVAMSSDDHTTLVTAVSEAGLVEVLSGEGPFTVFAPTNAAFAAQQETVDMLMMEENSDQFVAVLTYHVVPGKVMAADLSDGQEVTTVQGGTLTVRIMDGTVMLEDANGNMATVTATDLEAGNGVVHVIDALVTPAM